MVLNHHCYVYVNDDWSLLLEFLQSKFSDLFSDNLNHPDLWVRKYSIFTIGDSHDLKKFHQTKAIGSNKIALILLDSITAEAQQSLLKVIEEPYPGTIIFFIVPNTNLLLPTVLSRVEILELDSIKNNLILENEEVRNFLGLSISERLLLLEEWRKKDVIENRLWAKGLLDGIELFIKKNNVKIGLSAVLNIKKYISDQSFSFRLAFLYLALALPGKLS